MDCLQHGQRTAGENVVALGDILDAVGDKTLGTHGTILGCNQQTAAQLGELFQIESILCGAETQRNGGVLSAFQHSLCQTVQGSNTDAAAGQNGMFAGDVHVEAVAESGQHIQFLTGNAADQIVGAHTNHLDQHHQGLIGPVADGDGAAQEMTGHVDVHELTGCGDGRSIAGEDHLIGIGSQLPGVFHGKERLFHT